MVCPPPPTPIAVTVSPASATVAVGDTARFVALVSGSYSDPCSDEVRPVPSRAVSWSVSNGSVAIILATRDSATVTVRGSGAGTASVIATAVAEPTWKGAALLVVK